RSRMSPMNVKNGTASNVSFDMTPQIRSGSACSSVGCSNPSSMPTMPKKMPTAASENATGYPISSTTTSATNISGAMFSIRNAVMRGLLPSVGPHSGEARCAFRRASLRTLGLSLRQAFSLLGELALAARLENLLGKLLLGRLLDVLLARVGYQ